MERGVVAQEQRAGIAHLYINLCNLWLSYFSGKTLHHRHKFPNLNRLRDVGIETCSERAHSILRPRVSRESDRREVLVRLTFSFANLLDQAVTVNANHADVANQQVKLLRWQKLECIGG